MTPAPSEELTLILNRLKSHVDENIQEWKEHPERELVIYRGKEVEKN